MSEKYVPVSALAPLLKAWEDYTAGRLNTQFGNGMAEAFLMAAGDLSRAIHRDAVEATPTPGPTVGQALWGPTPSTSVEPASWGEGLDASPSRLQGTLPATEPAGEER